MDSCQKGSVYMVFEYAEHDLAGARPSPSPPLQAAENALTAHFPCARAHALAEGSAGEGPHQGLPQAAPRGPALPAHPEDPVRPLRQPYFFRTEGRRGLEDAGRRGRGRGRA